MKVFVYFFIDMEISGKMGKDLTFHDVSLHIAIG